jgi:hypothetical protein
MQRPFKLFNHVLELRIASSASRFEELPLSKKEKRVCEDIVSLFCNMDGPVSRPYPTSKNSSMT